eukprot:Blabericola_migrator_1__13193@NODE_909_length_6106_cov_111_915218_g635_i0_p1_GENE_NODE_909_length_6106_cov_111_915218_g635_i0NODE_909_length_6106_cov_111_915218_g635_i0_p1_ORF_typecomplete_len906_score124_75_NODE_909_length_6106_cov_111_915218_g635_i02112928
MEHSLPLSSPRLGQKPEELFANDQSSVIRNCETPGSGMPVSVKQYETMEELPVEPHADSSSHHSPLKTISSFDSPRSAADISAPLKEMPEDKVPMDETAASSVGFENSEQFASSESMIEEVTKPATESEENPQQAVQEQVAVKVPTEAALAHPVEQTLREPVLLEAISDDPVSVEAAQAESAAVGVAPTESVEVPPAQINSVRAEPAQAESAPNQATQIETPHVQAVTIEPAAIAPEQLEVTSSVGPAHSEPAHEEPAQPTAASIEPFTQDSSAQAEAPGEEPRQEPLGQIKSTQGVAVPELGQRDIMEHGNSMMAEPKSELEYKEKKDTGAGLFKPFEVHRFETLEAAEATITLPNVSNSIVEDAQSTALIKKRPRNSVRTSVKPSHPKRSRSSAPPPRDDDDTEVSEGSAPQPAKPARKRARMTEGSSRPSLPPSELSLHDMPEGWTSPLLYFVRQSDVPEWRSWKKLPNRCVCNGAVWLSSTCTGTPGVPNHVEGPTVILRDLMSLLQSPSDDLKLHANNYTSLARGNSRSAVSVSKISQEFAVTRIIKAQTEKDPIQRLPLDFVCLSLVQQLRVMMAQSKLFPTHIFQNELHLFQYAPTIAYHLVANYVSPRLADLLTAFSDDEGKAALESLTQEYNKRVGGHRILGSRRRGEGAATATTSFFMTNDLVVLLETLLASVERNLQKVQNLGGGLQTSAEKPISTKDYQKGEIIIRDLSVQLIPRSAAALRDRAYDFYDMPSYIIPFNPAMVAEADQVVYSQAVAMHSREEAFFLDSLPTQYLDLTLSEDQEKWLISKERWEHRIPPPGPEPDRLRVQYLVSHTSSLSNARIVISMPPAESSGKWDKAPARNKVLLSIEATRDIKATDDLVLGSHDRRATWAEIADDDVSALEQGDEAVQSTD